MTTAPVDPEPTDPAPTPPQPPQKLPRLYPVLMPRLILSAMALFLAGYVLLATVFDRSIPRSPILLVAFLFQGAPAVMIWQYRARQRVRRAHRVGRAFDPADVAELFKSTPRLFQTYATVTDAPKGRAVHREFVFVRAFVLGIEWVVLHALILLIEHARRSQPYPDFLPEFLRPIWLHTPSLSFPVLLSSIAVGFAAINAHALYVLWRTKLGPDDCRSCGYHAVRSAAMPKCPECGEPLPERT